MDAIWVVLLLLILVAVVAGPILAIIALVQVISLRRRVAELSRKLVRPSAHEPVAPAAQSLRAEPLRPAPAAPPEPQAQEPAAPPIEPAPTAAPQPQPAPVRILVPPQAPQRGGIELFVGKKMLAWVGIAVFLICAALFVKYAFERKLLPPQAKVLIMMAFGLAMLVVGEWFSRKHWTALARTLSGGGIATLLFTCFAAMSLWELIQWQACLAFMAIVVAMAIFLSVRYGSLTIAVIATLAGVAVPLMLWDDDLNWPLVFAFLATVDAGVMVLAWFRRWRVINLLALAGTVLVVLGWLGDVHGFVLRTAAENSVDGIAPLAAIAVVGGFYALFLLVSLVYHLGGRRPERALDLPLLLLNPLWAYATIYNLFNDDYHVWMAPTALSVAALYLILGMLIRVRQSQAKRIVLLSVAMALAWLTLAIPIQLDGMMIPMAFAVEAMLLFLVAARGKEPRLQWGGLAVYACMVISLFWYADDLADTYDRVILNSRFVTLAVCVVSLAVTAVIVRRQTTGDVTARATAAAAAALLAHVLALALFTVETNNFFELHRDFANSHLAKQLTYSLGYALYAAGLLTAGFAVRRRYLRIAALVLFAATVLKVLVYDLSEMEYLYRIFSFLGLAVLLLTGAYLYHKFQHVLLPEPAKKESGDENR